MAFGGLFHSTTIQARIFFSFNVFKGKKMRVCRSDRKWTGCKYRYYILRSAYYGLMYLHRLYILCGIFCQVFFPMAIRYQDAGIYVTDLFVQPFSVGSASTRTSMNAGGGGWISAEY